MGRPFHYRGACAIFAGLVIMGLVHTLGALDAEVNLFSSHGDGSVRGAGTSGGLPKETDMPHYYDSWTRTHNDYVGVGLDNPDSHANTDHSYLSNDPVDDANGEIIVPGVYVDELTTFPPVGKSPPFDGEEAADSFVWDAVEPAHDGSEPGLDGSGLDIGLDLALFAADAAQGEDEVGDHPTLVVHSADAMSPEIRETGKSTEGDGLFI